MPEARITVWEFNKRLIAAVEKMSAAQILNYAPVYAAFVDVLRSEIKQEWQEEQEEQEA